MSQNSTKTSGGNTGGAFNRLKAHQTYYTKNKTKVPGVTTVLQVMPKPQLIHWAWDMGLQGLDYQAVRDRAGDVGTLIHRLCECHLRGWEIKTSTDQYSPDDQKIAFEQLENFKRWWDREGLSYYDTELRLVSEEYSYGGTIDLPCVHPEDMRIVMLDLKSGKAIYKEQWVQLAAYKQLLQENTGCIVDKCTIIRMGKNGKDDFEVKDKKNLSKEWQVFEAALAFHNALKLLS